MSSRRSVDWKRRRKRRVRKLLLATALLLTAASFIPQLTDLYYLGFRGDPPASSILKFAATFESSWSGTSYEDYGPQITVFRVDGEDVVMVAITVATINHHDVSHLIIRPPSYELEFVPVEVVVRSSHSLGIRLPAHFKRQRLRPGESVVVGSTSIETSPKDPDAGYTVPTGETTRVIRYNTFAAAFTGQLADIGDPIGFGKYRVGFEFDPFWKRDLPYRKKGELLLCGSCHSYNAVSVDSSRPSADRTSFGLSATSVSYGSFDIASQGLVILGGVLRWVSFAALGALGLGLLNFYTGIAQRLGTVVTNAKLRNDSPRPKTRRTK